MEKPHPDDATNRDSRDNKKITPQPEASSNQATRRSGRQREAKPQLKKDGGCALRRWQHVTIQAAHDSERRSQSTSAPASGAAVDPSKEGGEEPASNSESDDPRATGVARPRQQLEAKAAHVRHGSWCVTRLAASSDNRRTMTTTRPGDGSRQTTERDSRLAYPRSAPTATRLPKWSDGAKDARSCWIRERGRRARCRKHSTTKTKTKERKEQIEAAA